MFDILHRIAAHRWVTVAGLPLLLEAYWYKVAALFNGKPITMNAHELFDLFVKLMLWLFVWVLQGTVRDMNRRWKAQRVVDSVIHQVRAEILYRIGQGARSAAEMKQRLNDRLSEEYRLVVQHLAEHYRTIPAKDLDQALADHYGPTPP